MFSGCDQHRLASLLCLAVAVNGHSCRKCHYVSDFGCPRLRQYLQAFRMHTSVGRSGSPALRPWPPQSSLDMIIADLTLYEWWWITGLVLCPLDCGSECGE